MSDYIKHLLLLYYHYDHVSWLIVIVNCGRELNSETKYFIYRTNKKNKSFTSPRFTKFTFAIQDEKTF